MLGRPIGHSLSPVLHSAAYEALGLTGWRYQAVDCGEDELAGVVDRLGPEWAGLSLTMPLKRVALTVADEVTPLAAAVGAANTLLLGACRLADNTDVAGIVAALREAGVGKVEHALVLGAGGTAQAALAALRELGATTPTVLVRDVARTAGLLAAADRLDVTPDVRAGLADLPPADRLDVTPDVRAGLADLPPADVVISTLPAGAADGLRVARPGSAVLDVVYAPWPTPFAATAAATGARVVSGLAMLLHQAAAQVELMTGHPAPLDAMRAALTAATR